MIEWVTIPAGEFAMGSEGANVLDESPVHRVLVGTFQIARTPVTNALYKRFTEATGYHAPGHWAQGEIPGGLGDHPVTYVSWFDANAFAEWLNARLPTEAEWEKAARGPADRSGEARVFPWGDAPADAAHAHYAQDVKRGGTCAVHVHAEGASVYGVLDQAGNVWEWVSTVYRAYPYRTDDGREDRTAQGARVLRGGSFYSTSDSFIHCTTRSSSFPTRRRDHIGFRVARSI